MRSRTRGLAIGVLALWAGLCLARLSLLVAPTPPAPGAYPGLGRFLAVAEAVIPPDAAYLHVLPPADADTGIGPRLRYELYPRLYTGLPEAAGEAAAQALVRAQGLRYVVVAQPASYPPQAWQRQDRPWFRRLAVGQDGSILLVEP
jgi:hypothetical protein